MRFFIFAAMFFGGEVLTNYFDKKIALVIYLTACFLIFGMSGQYSSAFRNFVLVSSYFLGSIFVGALFIDGGLQMHSIRSALYSSIGFVCFVCVYMKHELELIKIVQLFCILVCSSLICSFVYIKLGFGPMFIVENMDGLFNEWYFLSFNRVNFANEFRLSWIFDEPGTLSYYLTFSVLILHLSGVKRIYTAGAMVIGLISFSLFHLLATVIYVSYVIVEGKKGQIAYVFLGLIFAVGYLFSVGILSSEEISESSFFSRINTDEGVASGNNRSSQITSFMRIVDFEIIFFGKPRCGSLTDRDISCSLDGDLTSSIITPIYLHGLIYSAPFFLTLLFLIKSIFVGNNRIIGLIIILTFLQRPYFMDYQYIFLSSLLLANYFRASGNLNLRY